MSLNEKERQLIYVAQVEKNLRMRARLVAHIVHYDQKRKYTREPFVIHPIRVMERVGRYPGHDDDMMCAALLHDTVEDCEWFNFDVLVALFPPEVFTLVYELTDRSAMLKEIGIQRADRMKIDRERLKTVSTKARILKLFDRIDNVTDMINCNVVPKEFVQLYIEESILLGQTIGGVDTRVQGWLFDVCEKLRRNIDE
jgi:(p)ppGpp synthase/HD superfamily hydrolase